MPKRIMRTFKLAEISAVDRPAQEHAKLTLIKREFSADERRRDARSGAAENDGSFPIENSTDLHNAMRAVGRSKNPSKTRAHIRSRARALGLTSQLSDAFKREESAMSKFIELLSPSKINEAVAALAKSVGSIVKPNAEQTAKLAETFAEFDEVLEKSSSAGSPAPTDKHGDTIMPLSEKLVKALGLKADATEDEAVKALADRELDLAIAKAGMSDDEKKYHDGLAADAQEGFRKMSRDERKAAMNKSVELPEHVRKQLAETDELKKRIAAMEESAALAGFTKQAESLGLPSADAITLKKAYEGDKASVDKLLAVVKNANAAAEHAGLFKEIGAGGNGGRPATAYDELVAKAAELRKADPKLTKQQAFEKVYTDPDNGDLVMRHKADEARKMGAVAA